ASRWDTYVNQKYNMDGGFWRIVYNSTSANPPIANWSTLVEPGDIVNFAWQGGGGHAITVLNGGGQGNTDPITIYDNGYQPTDTTGSYIGIRDSSPWNRSKPDQVLIYRLDPKQQYLITGSSNGEFIQGSVYNNLINPGGGADTITAGLGNNEIADTQQ